MAGSTRSCPEAQVCRSDSGLKLNPGIRPAYLAWGLDLDRHTVCHAGSLTGKHVGTRMPAILQHGEMVDCRQQQRCRISFECGL